MTMLRRLATTILSLGCAVGVVACGSPARGQIDQGSKLLGQNKRAEAFAAFDAAVKLDPNNAGALGGRGCSRPMSDTAEAVADLNRAIEIDPKAADAYRCRAEVQRAAGQLDGALVDARKAIELDPSHAYPHVTLAVPQLRRRDPVPDGRVRP